MNNKKKTVEYGKYGYAFIAPFFIVFLIFQFYPLLYTFYASTLVKAGRGSAVTFDLVGNYSKFIFGSDKTFWYSLGITVVLWLLNFIPQIVMSLLLASWFTDQHNKLKGQGAYKVIIYMPNIITAATIAVLFNNLFCSQGSIIVFLRDVCKVKIPDGGILDHGWYSLIIIAFIQFWMWYGNTMIVLIAGIMGINPSLYEAAMVDGATANQQFFKITLPLLKPILQYTMVTSCIGGLQMFDIPSLFNKGGPDMVIGADKVRSTRTVVMLIKDYIAGGETSSSYNVGRASAYSVCLFIVTLAVSMIFFLATSERKEHK